MLWLERVLGIVGVFRDVSSSLACPFHCGGSALPVFGFGFATGLLCGLFVAFYLFHTFVHSLTAPSKAPAPEVFASVIPKRRSRVAGYLHE